MTLEMSSGLKLETIEIASGVHCGDSDVTGSFHTG